MKKTHAAQRHLNRRVLQYTRARYRCRASDKVRYRDHLEATTALHSAKSRRALANAAGLHTRRRVHRS